MTDLDRGKAAFRRVYGQLCREMEDRGLGEWFVDFRPYPGREVEAEKYTENRSLWLIQQHDQKNAEEAPE